MKRKVIVALFLLAVTIGVSFGKEMPFRSWFNGGIAEGFPMAPTMKGGFWEWDSEWTDAYFKEGMLEVDADYENTVDFDATQKVSLENGRATVVTEILPYPTQQNETTNSPGVCKTAFSVGINNGVSNYFGVAKIDGIRKWVVLEGAEWKGDIIKVSITVERENGISYASFNVIDSAGVSTDLTYNGNKKIEILVDDLEIKGVGFGGSGKITSVTSLKSVEATEVVPATMLFYRQ